MLKIAVLALGLGLSMAAQAEMKMDAQCLSNIRSSAKSDAESTLAPVKNLASGQIAQLGKIAGKDFSLTLVESQEGNPFPDMVEMTVKDGASEITTSSMPGKDGLALVATVIKSPVTGESVAVSCEVKVKQK